MHRAILGCFMIITWPSSSCSLDGFVRRQEMTFINQFQHFRFYLWLFFAFWAEMGASWRLVCPSMVVTCPANFKVWFLPKWFKVAKKTGFAQFSRERLAIIRWQWTLNSYQSPLGCFLKGKKKKSFKISASYRLSVWRVSEGCKQTIFFWFMAKSIFFQKVSLLNYVFVRGKNSFNTLE